MSFVNHKALSKCEAKHCYRNPFFKTKCSETWRKQHQPDSGDRQNSQSNKSEHFMSFALSKHLAVSPESRNLGGRFVDCPRASRDQAGLGGCSGRRGGLKEDAESLPRNLAERCPCFGGCLRSNSYFLFTGVLMNPEGKDLQKRKPRLAQV